MFAHAIAGIIYPPVPRNLHTTCDRIWLNGLNARWVLIHADKYEITKLPLVGWLSFFELNRQTDRQIHMQRLLILCEMRIIVNCHLLVSVQCCYVHCFMLSNFELVEIAAACDLPYCLLRSWAFCVLSSFPELFDAAAPYLVTGVLCAVIFPWAVWHCSSVLGNWCFVCCHLSLRCLTLQLLAW